MKKQSNLSRLMGYAGGHRYLTYASWILSAISALVALIPFIYIWRILDEVLRVAPDFGDAKHITHYGWMAVLFAMLSMLIYISRLIKDKTVLVIAHRMRTVAGADKIVVLSDGLVAEEGTPNELYQRNGIYSRMVKLQTESQNWVLE